jgi:hypothetical protein
MDESRCVECNRRLMAMTDRTGRTKLVCLKCKNIDPMKTDAIKWAKSSLVGWRQANFGSENPNRIGSEDNPVKPEQGRKGDRRRRQ